MALQVNFTSERFGFTFPEAYARIVSIQSDKNITDIQVGFYTDQRARERGAHPVDGSSFRTDTTELASELFPSAYNWLKANVDEFADAIDV